MLKIPTEIFMLCFLIFSGYFILRKLLPISFGIVHFKFDFKRESVNKPNKKYLQIFDDETKLIRAQTASILKSIHLPVPRYRSQPITSLNR